MSAFVLKLANRQTMLLFHFPIFAPLLPFYFLFQAMHFTSYALLRLQLSSVLCSLAQEMWTC